MSPILNLKRRLATPRDWSFGLALKANEALAMDSLAQLNRMRRVELVQFAFARIPFYRRKYAEAGIEARDLADPDAFARLPILERADIVAYEADLVNPDFRRDQLPVFTTGGSTGRPLKTYGDPRVPHAALSWRMLEWWGTGIHDNSGYLYRAVPVGWRRAAQKIALWPTRREWISAASMTPGRMESFYRALLRIRPRYLVGYVGALDVFARFLEERKYSLPGLQAVWTTSAPLPEVKRRYFENIYGCKAYTQYGSCEFYWIAAECHEQSGMHIATDARHVEVVNERNEPVPDGEWGDLIVTDLLNYAFPLIRYRIGDRGRLLSGKCPCGRPFPMMGYVRGRISDVIHVPGGADVPGEYWTTIFDDFTDAIKAFLVHQNQDLSVEIRYEPYEGKDADPVVAAVAAKLRQSFGPSLQVVWKRVPVESNDNGKLRLVTSDAAR